MTDPLPGATSDPGAAFARVFDAPLLRSIDAPSRSRLTAVARLRTLPANTTIYGIGDDADTLFVVVSGKVALYAIKRGDAEATMLREAGEFDSFGEESTLGLGRRSTAVSLGPVDIVEFPASVFARAAGRVGGSIIAEREQRILARAVTADALRTTALCRDLDATDFDAVLDAALLRRCERGERIYGAGDASVFAFLVADGLVQIQAPHNESPDGAQSGTETTVVRAYLQPGDLAGEHAALTGRPHDYAAVSLGPSVVLALPAAVLRSVIDRNRGLLDRVRRIADDRSEVQERVVGAAVERSTQHAFVDLYRMQMARSLLVIDQDTCVRCGHCAWSCAATHDGVARLVRRGDKIVTSLAVLEDAPRSLLIPNSCQHCKNPACMVDCPTGAIGRDPGGDVFIREALCTGCTACAKACPWDNIQMAPRTDTKRRGGIEGLSDTIAVKCDLCHGYEAPACVESCPTGSLLRLDPHRDVSEVAAVLGPTGVRGPRPVGRARPRGGLVVASLCAALLGLGVGGVILQGKGVLVPGASLGLVAGWIAAVGCLVSLLYAVPKRVHGSWRRRAKRRGLRERIEPAAEKLPKSKMRPLLGVHLLVGSAALGGALAHGGLRTGGLAGALDITFVAATVLGVLGSIAYWILPSRLSRLEREGALPEDLRRRGPELVDLLYKQISGKDAVVKQLVDRILLPYMRRPLGPLHLLASGRTLPQERRHVRAGIDKALQGHAQERLSGLDPAIRTAVDRRALGVRRWLVWLLRGWLIPHVVLSVIATALLGAHMLVMVGWP